MQNVAQSSGVVTTRQRKVRERGLDSVNQGEEEEHNYH